MLSMRHTGEVTEITLLFFIYSYNVHEIAIPVASDLHFHPRFEYYLNPNHCKLVHVLKTATDFSKWIPEATRIRTEAGIHHSCDFSVYQVTYQGQTIEFKCKITDGELLYMMKFI